MRTTRFLISIIIGLLSCVSYLAFSGAPIASGATGPSVARAASATLVLPVLREKFTLLPCNKNTTIGLEGCAEHRIVALDRQVNTLRRTVFHQLNNAVARDFILAENDWYRYRQAMCTSESDVNAGGSLQPVDFAQCLVRLDAQHVRELTTMKMSNESGG
jgi:uncharacterized protein YecT (DUF1311 family)